MHSLQKLSLSLAAAYGAALVALAAVTMHLGLQRLTTAELGVVVSALAMLAVHALAILVLSYRPATSRLLAAALLCWHLGSWLFVYTLLAGVWQLPWHFGRLAPIGGQLLILGWLLLAISPWFGKRA
ncbi:DUF423 domain-containing protein [Alkalimonas amylolytica]|uniref:Uncharacterized membrane protein YgdD, TMEM256/DUF423 family n=1 Tax=Alkalimonas amylolytica TaxID=152573 RepID=A0A1H3WYD9_ALKAM|nr:DUF423 domain-containing protein [Alkalimonas amylolytica]SDZ91761.1 Uncharacterized membrane protein YgdD, TMEM256/DUF423 family [Alkalimonas amylolytica]